MVTGLVEGAFEPIPIAFAAVIEDITLSAATLLERWPSRRTFQTPKISTLDLNFIASSVPKIASRLFPASSCARTAATASR